MSVGYACVSCGRTYQTDEVIYLCPACSAEKAAAGGGFQKGILITTFQPRESFRPGLPMDPKLFLPLAAENAAFSAGNTPLVEPHALRRKTGFPRLFFKNEALNPSGSLKDRASMLVVEQARLHGEKRIALASTGNAGASMACAGAACGLQVVLFVPAAAPRAKLLQALLFGAKVVPIAGPYDEAFRLSIEYTTRHGGINRNTGFNPFTIEGKKTVSIEIFNQLDCMVPDAVYVPTGDGVILGGVWKGFSDLVTAGLAEKMPALISVQVDGSNAIARSWREGRQVALERASTIADSLAVASPVNGEMALQCLAKTGGRAVEVSDEETSRAQAELCKESGLFVEPSSAAAWAGFRKDMPNLDPGSRVVVLLTGTGFKDIAAAEKLVSLPDACAPDLDSALRLLESSYGIKSGEP